MASIHENLIATMALRAGQMEGLGLIALPSGVEGEDLIADFCVDKVEEFQLYHFEEPFDIFIETELQKRFAPEEGGFEG